MIKEFLFKSVSRGRISHAYLFSGPLGSGKRETALFFAEMILCPDRQENKTCGRCRSCSLVRAGNHPDLRLVEPEGRTIKINQIRKMVEEVSLEPYLGRHKVYIFDKAEMMTSEAANSMLKILEEPPGKTVFILLSSGLQLLPPTIVSRCCKVSFKEEQVSSLSETAGETNLLDRVVDLADSFKDLPVWKLLHMAGELSQDRFLAAAFLESLMLWYRDLLVAGLPVPGEMLINSERISQLKRKAGCYDVFTLISMIRAVEKAKRNLSGNANTKLLMEVLFLRLKNMHLDMGDQNLSLKGRDYNDLPGSGNQV